LRFPVGGKWKYVGAVVRCNWRREGREGREERSGEEGSGEKCGTEKRWDYSSDEVQTANMEPQQSL